LPVAASPDWEAEYVHSSNGAQYGRILERSNLPIGGCAGRLPWLRFPGHGHLANSFGALFFAFTRGPLTATAGVVMSIPGYALPP